MSNMAATRTRASQHANDKNTLEVLVTALRRVALISGFIVISAGLMAVAFWSVGQLADLRVQRITVAGATEQVTPAAIRRVMEPHLEQQFMAIDLAEVRKQLEHMPWVHSANIRRQWPDTLAVHIKEQLPIARWNDRGFLNHEGRFFSGDMAPRWQGLPNLVGPEGTQANLMKRYQMLESLMTGLELRLQQLSEDSLGQVSFVLADGTEVMLGDRALALRARRFAELYQHHLSSGQVTRIDLRYEHGAAVRVIDQQFVAAVDKQKGQGHGI